MDRTSSGELNQLSKTHKCLICQKELKKANLQSHARRRHSDALKPIVCNHCPKRFHTKYELKIHIVRIHTKIYPFNCSRCPKSFPSAAQLKYHLSGHTNVGLQECLNCDKKFTRFESLKAHRIAKHAEVSDFICTICGFASYSSYRLDQHVRSHTGEKPYKCEECDKSYPSASGLRVHSQFHKGRTHKCTFCEFAAVEKTTLTRHMRTVHSDERPFSCEFCPRQFKTKLILRRHIGTHTQEKPYSCEVCAASFKQAVELTSHKRTHTNRKDFKCESCGKGFKAKHSLKYHMTSRNCKHP